MDYKNARIFDANGDLNERWFVFYFFRDPDTNKWVRFRHWISSKLVTRTSRYNKAREIQLSIDKQLAQGYNPFIAQDRGLSVLIQTLDYYLDVKGRSLRSRTMISYRSYINHFKDWLQSGPYKNISVRSINYHIAEQYMDYLWEEKHPAPRTWNNTLQALRSCFNFLMKKEFCLVNPFFRLEEVPTEDTEIIAFTQAELEIISKNLPSYNHDLYVIALLIFNCFLRPQEIVRLQVHHLKDAYDYLAIPGNVSKNKKNQVVALSSQLQKEIRKMNLNYPSNYYVFGYHLKRNKDQNYPTRIAEAWKEFAGQHELCKNIYALKHTGNGMAMRNGANARDLQLQNRHSSLEETQKYLDRFSRLPSKTFTDNFPTL